MSMTDRDAILELQNIKERLKSRTLYDEEDAHVEADDVLVSLLDSMGFTDLVEAYNDIPKWYA